MATKQKKCPRCGKFRLEKPLTRNAVSRRDNKTYICHSCGNDEALFDFAISESRKKGLYLESDLRFAQFNEAKWVLRFHKGFPKPIADICEKVSAALMGELLKAATTADEKQRIHRLAQLPCRIDVYHFEQLVFIGRENPEDEDDFMDPGALLIVMEKIAKLCDGVIVDPQAYPIL